MRMVPLRKLRLVTSARLDAAQVRREFPTVDVEVASASGARDALVDANAWLLGRDFRLFDAVIEGTCGDTVGVHGAATSLLRAACEVLTRYQRHVRRRNAASTGPVFDLVLRAHGTGVESPIAARAHAIVASRERRGVDPDVDLLSDADALSFFSLSSSGYIDSFGPAQTKRKIACTLRRASPRALQLLFRTARLRADVAALLANARAA